MNESLLSRTKRSPGASHDAAGKCASVRASARNGDHGTNVVRVAPRGERKGIGRAGRREECRRMVFGRQVCRCIGNCPAERSGAGRVLPAQRLVYPEQIAAWRASCVAANANATEQAREQRLSFP
jgi:hypothetical protein